MLHVIARKAKPDVGLFLSKLCKLHFVAKLINFLEFQTIRVETENYLCYTVCKYA